jgi:hypothetical protein
MGLELVFCAMLIIVEYLDSMSDSSLGDISKSRIGRVSCQVRRRLRTGCGEQVDWWVRVANAP